MYANAISFLIIEDNESDYFLANYHLKKHFTNANFTHCDSVLSFKECFENANPNVIICDFQLRDGTGLDVLLETVKRDKDIPFIFFTGALNNEQKAADAIFTGADGYILKDNIALLHETVLKVLNNRAEKERIKKEKQAKINQALEHVQSASSNEIKETLSKELQKVQDILKDLRKDLDS